MKDYLIVGFGFAGSSFAHLLEKNQKSFIVFNDNPAPVTTVAGAMFNPIILKRFTAVWKAQEQMHLLVPFFSEIEKKLATPLLHKVRVFRKFTSVEEKNNWFVASDKPILSEYLSTEIINELSPCISTPFGLGEVLHTGMINTRNLIPTYQKKLEKEGKFFEEKFDYNTLEIKENSICYKGISAKKIIFCEGYGMVNNPFFNTLPMVGSKGELLSFEADNLHLEGVIKSDGFIAPLGGNHFKIGTTYDNDDKDPSPTSLGREILIEKLERLISCPYHITDQVAGIRPTIRDRRPLVGVHPIYKQLFILNGLGTHGALLAPFTATSLFNFIEKGEAIDKEMNINRFLGKK